MRRRVIGIAVATLLALGAATVFVPTVDESRFLVLPRARPWSRWTTPGVIYYDAIWRRNHFDLRAALALAGPHRTGPPPEALPAVWRDPIVWPLLIATHLAILALGAAGVWFGVVRPRRRSDSGARLAA